MYYIMMSLDIYVLISVAENLGAKYAPVLPWELWLKCQMLTMVYKNPFPLLWF